MGPFFGGVGLLDGRSTRSVVSQRPAFDFLPLFFGDGPSSVSGGCTELSPSFLSASPSPSMGAGWHYSGVVRVTGLKNVEKIYQKLIKTIKM